MRVKSLNIRNFKGISGLELVFDGRDATISGENSTGKTSVQDALFWLLLDKNHEFKSAPIKPLDENGNEIHNLETEVVGTFIIDDRTEITLGKLFKEDWVRKRGEAEKQFSGHKTLYSINGVPCRQKDFKDALGGIVPSETTFRTLSSPYYFAGVLHWQKRREVLMSLCEGQMSDVEVVTASGNKQLERLLPMLENSSEENLRKQTAATIKQINAQLQAVPVRIDEVTRMIPPVDTSTLKATIKKAANVAREIKEKKRFSNNAQLRGVRTKMETQERRISEMRLKAEKAHADKIMDIEGQILLAKRQIAGYEADIERGEEAKTRLKNIEHDLELKRNEYDKEKFRQFEPGNATCEVCGAPLSEEKQKEYFEKAKAMRLRELKREGVEIANTHKHLLSLVATYDKATDEKKKLLRKIDTLETKLVKLKKVGPDYPHARIEACKGKATVLRKQLNEMADAAYDKVDTSDLEEKHDALLGEIATIEQAITLKARVEALMEEEKRLSREWEEATSLQILLDEFSRTKATAMEKKVLKKLGVSGLSIKLFDIQINGGLAPTCEVLYKGVPFTTGLNHGGQIECGLKLINSLSKIFGVEVPVVVDNAEAITDIPKIRPQMIKMVVKEGVTPLKMMLARAKK